MLSPRYGPGYRMPGNKVAIEYGKEIDGSGGGWRLPLPPFNVSYYCTYVYDMLYLFMYCLHRHDIVYVWYRLTY